MATKLTKYIMSELFHENARRGIARAVAQTRAAGLVPAGNTRIKGPSEIKSTTLIPAPKRAK